MWSGSRDPFLKFCPNHICGNGEARQHLKFHVLIDTQEYQCMHDRLPPKGMCLESRDLFTFLEKNYNISLTVQDGGIVATKH